jgi:hypothetical protein
MRRLSLMILIGLISKLCVGSAALTAPSASQTAHMAASQRLTSEPVPRQPSTSQPPASQALTGVPLTSEPLGPGVAVSSPSYTNYLPLMAQRYVPGYASPFGIVMYDSDTDADGLPQMQSAGSAWMTVALHWSDVEPTAPISGVHTYDWSRFDATVARAQAAGMSIFVLFADNPAWAAQYRNGPVTNTVDLISVVSAAAQRYNGSVAGSPVINYWSFYAEPDNGALWQAKLGKGYWGGVPACTVPACGTPAGYADMLAGVSAAIRAANPNAVVMIGGLAYDAFTTDGGPFVQGFLAGVLDQLNSAHGGAAATLGAVAFHYYPISTGRWPTIKEKAQEIRSIMTQHGAGSLPLIVPEMGYWSDSLGSSEPLQASALVQMFVRGLSVGIQQMSWFMVFDSGPGTETHGLFRGTDLNSPKPAYTAYATLTSQLFGARYHGPLTGAGIEGYVFDMSDGRQKSVLWATQPSAQFTFHATCLRRVDYVGNVTAPITDGSASDLDHIPGQITLPVLANLPIYVGGC